MMPPIYRIAEITVYSLLNFLPFLMIALYPFRRHLRFPLPVTWLLAGMVTMVQIGLGIWAGLFDNGNVGLISAVSTLAYFLFYFSAVKTHFGKPLFTLLMLSNIANFVVMASKCIEGIFFPEMAQQSYRWTFSLAMAGVEILTLIPLFFYIRNTYSAVFEKVIAESIWRFIWLIPATFYVIWYYNLYASNMSSLDLALLPSTSIFMFLINMGAMLIYHMVASLINITADNMELSEQNHALAMQNLQYGNLQSKLAEARQAKHDIRHHISILRSYLQSEEYDKLEDYLNSYQKSLPDDGSIVLCENHAANVLFLYIAEQCKAAGIDFSVQTHVPENLGIPDNDLSVLLGNLLENALDACLMQKHGERKIVVHAKTDGASIFFTIDNSFESVLRQDKRGNYLSTKEHGSGLGLVSVKSIVERYDGSLLINHDDGMFRVSVMLNPPMQD